MPESLSQLILLELRIHTWVSFSDQRESSPNVPVV